MSHEPSDEREAGGSQSAGSTTELPGGENLGGSLPHAVVQFHQALRAALRAGIPLQLGQASNGEWVPDLFRLGGKMPSGNLTTAKLLQLESAISDQATSLTAKSAAPVDTLVANPAFPERYRVALWAYAAGGRTDLIMEGLAVDSRARGDLARVLRPPLMYLLVMMLIASLGLLLFSAFGSPIIDAMRADLQLLPQAAVAPRQVTTAQVRLLASVLPLVALGVLVLAFSVRGSAAMVRGFGGRGYRTSRSTAIAARLEQSLLDAGVSSQDASSRAHALVGLHPSELRTRLTFPGRGGREAAAARLALISHHFRDISNTRLRQLRIAVPLLLITTIGGLGVLMYALILFVPLISLLRDLAIPFAGEVR